MDQEQRRFGITGMLLVAALLITAYRVIIPTTSATTAIATVLGATAVFIILIEHQPRPDRWPLLSWRHTFLLTVISGMATVITVYAAATVLLLANQMSRSHLLATVLYELLQQTRFMETTAPVGFILLFGTATILLGTGFWLLHPYTPTRHRYATAILLFPVLALYIGAFGALLLPILRPIIPVEWGMDLILATVWGGYFTLAYHSLQNRL